MLFNFLNRLTKPGQRTHVLFCIPRNEGAMGPLPQFYALPVNPDGVVYFFDPSYELNGLKSNEIASWLKKETKKSMAKFSGSSSTIEQFKEGFGKNLKKEHVEFSAGEPAYFGGGNFGFCMGGARLEGDIKAPSFVLS